MKNGQTQNQGSACHPENQQQQHQPDLDRQGL